jgi:FAD/FMN-containing dehydrogenase
MTFRGLRGEPVSLAQGAVDEGLRAKLEGESLTPADSGYAEARRVWNAMIDRSPALLARCAHAEDVQRCIRFAGEHGLALTVRGGGHNIGGRALADGALTVDLEPRRGVRVDAEQRDARVEPGARLGDVDHSTQAHGLAVPSGIISETGIAGLTLGGGFGWLSRRFGLTCDHLTEAEVVTGTGDIVHAGDESHPDLMWALRGGGGGLGIVTRFRYRLRPVGPTVTAGPMFHDLEGAEAALRRFRACADAAPETLTCMLKLGAAPAAPFLPESMHGQPAAITVACHSGDSGAEDSLAPLRTDASPAADLIQERSFVQFQSMFDAGEPRGRRDYWKSEYVTDLDDEMAAALLSALRRLPSASANIKVFQLGGAVSRVPPEATAAGHRDARYIVVIASAWDEPSADEANIGWVRDTWRRIHERSGRGGYINFLTEDAGLEEQTRALSGVDRDRLDAIRRRYDPDGLLRAAA